MARLFAQYLSILEQWKFSPEQKQFAKIGSKFRPNAKYAIKKFPSLVALL